MITSVRDSKKKELNILNILLCNIGGIGKS
jgi:hypothetical protein